MVECVCYFSTVFGSEHSNLSLMILFTFFAENVISHEHYSEQKLLFTINLTTVEHGYQLKKPRHIFYQYL